MFYNMDCVEGAKKYLASNSVDLIITDPPYGISGDTLHKHYNRNEDKVLNGYIEIPASQYAQFSRDWIAQAARVLKPGGSLYVVSGYTNLRHILNALAETALQEVNHIIWRYNFGVYTSKKYISSHYHILYYVKTGKEPTFNTYVRFSDSEKDVDGGALNYQDREDVWVINREYKPGEIKNKNELPLALLLKMIQYSSNVGDLVCDFFLGSFSTAKVALGLNRKAVGFEKSKIAFDHHIDEANAVIPGSLLSQLRIPPPNLLLKKGQPIEEGERLSIITEFEELRMRGQSKKEAIDGVSRKFGRGYWSVLRIIDGTTNKSKTHIDDELNFWTTKK